MNCSIPRTVNFNSNLGSTCIFLYLTHLKNKLHFGRKAKEVLMLFPAIYVISHVDITKLARNTRWRCGEMQKEGRSENGRKTQHKRGRATTAKSVH